MKRWLTVSLVISLGAIAAACGDDGGGTPDGGGGSGGQRPEITQVSWEPENGCTAGTRSSYTVTITATDPDTQSNMLTFSGSVPDCTPSPFTNRVQTISCPNSRPYLGSVTAIDPQNNRDTQDFTIRVCLEGTAP